MYNDDRGANLLRHPPAGGSFRSFADACLHASARLARLASFAYLASGKMTSGPSRALMDSLAKPRFRIPAGAFVLLKEVLRHLLRRPVVGIAAAARTDDGRYLLVRRGDVGEWALPGGTLEWGETLRTSIVRELAEEAGVQTCTVGRLVGVFSAPGRDLRFHAVTVVVACRIEPPVAAPHNPLEITEVRLFAPDALPTTLAMGMSDMLRAAMADAAPVLE